MKLNFKLLVMSMLICACGADDTVEQVNICSEYGSGRSPLFTSSGSSNTTDQGWSQVEYLSAPDGRIFHNSVWTGTNLLVWGGIVGGLTPGYSNAGSVYTAATNQWSTMSSTGAPSARFGHCASLTTSGKMFVWGGEGADGLLEDGFLYDPSANIWSSVSTLNAPSSRMWHSCHRSLNLVYVWGGISGDSSQLLTGGKAYNTETDVWTDISGTDAIPFVGSLFGESYLLEDQIFYFNGTTGQGAIYTISKDQWQEITTTDAPSNRYGFASSYDVEAKKFYLFGGGTESDGTNLNDLYVYDVTLDTWTQLSGTNAPTIRIGSKMTLSSEKLHVWGGWSSENAIALEDGGVYDVASDSWSSLDTTGAPPTRVLHTQVETDSGFLVWGGTSYLPVRTSGDSAVDYLRGGAKQSITDAEEKISQTTAEGEDALEQLKSEITTESLTLLGCNFNLVDENLFKLLFSMPVGGQGGEFKTASTTTSTTETSTVPTGSFTSTANLTSTEQVEETSAPAVSSSTPNCWNPFP